MWIVLLGVPGCGKGTQAEKLISDNGFVSLSTGDLLRANKGKVVDEEKGETIEDIISAGCLLPDHVTINLIKEEVTKLGNKNIIFDGFPRTLAQAEALEQMAEELDMKVDKVINFDISDEVIIKRITGRFKCANCGKIYNRFFVPLKVSGVCDVCGGTQFDERSDDNEESLKKRLDEYHKKTYPLIDFYMKSGILYNIKADSPLNEVTESIVKILNG